MTKKIKHHRQSGNSNTGVLKHLATQATERAAGFLMLPIEEVVSKAQVRTVFRNLEGLAKTIKNNQQQTPISVAPKNSEGKFVILRGERRWRACKIAGLLKIKAVIDEGKYSKEDLIVGELIENIQRDELTPLDVAAAIKKLSDGGLTPALIQEKLGKSRSYISMHLSISQNLPEKAAELHAAGYEMSAEAIYNLGLASKLDAGAVDSLCDTALLEERAVTRVESRNLLKQLTVKDTQEEAENLHEQKQVDAPNQNSGAAAPLPLQPTKPVQEPGPSSDSFSAGETNTHLPDSSDAAQTPPTLSTNTSAGAIDSGALAQEPNNVKVESERKNPTLSVFVTVSSDGVFYKGALSLSKSPPREGYAYIELDNGTSKSFPILDIKLLDVQGNYGYEDKHE